MGYKMKNIYLFFFINIIFLCMPILSFCSDMPEWVLKPDLEGYRYCGVGSADKTSSQSMQKKLAKINALSEISRIIEVDIANKIEITQQSSGKSEKNFSSSQNSNVLVKDAEEKDSFYDEKKSIYYIRLCVK